MRGRRPPDRTTVAGWLALRVPGLATLRVYEPSWLRHDVLAGLALSTILVPAGMGYAQASGLPPITGLYTSIAPLVAYAIFGPSRILVLGPDSALIPLVATTVLPLASGDTGRAVTLAAALGVLAGAVAVLAAACRLGFVTRLLSKPIRYGYLNGIAVIVILGQVPALLGFSVPSGGVPAEAGAMIRGVAAGEADALSAVVGIGALALILLLRATVPRVPGSLVAVVGSIAVVAGLGLSAHLAVVGPVPQGLPAPSVPAVRLSDLEALAPSAAVIALVAFTDTSLLSRTMAIRGRYDVDPNQELFALGAANIAGGLFHGFPVSSSASRTPVAVAGGARTQLTGVVGAAVIVLLLVAAPGLVADLPRAALAAVVIAAVVGLFEIRGVHRLLDLDRTEFALSVASSLAVIALGVLPGIGVAIGLSLLDFIRHAWRPYDAVLGREEGLKGYHDVTRHPLARQVPGLILYRWDAPLFFANADYFRDRIHRLVATADPPARRVVVAAEPITAVDSTAADMLERLETELLGAGVDLAFAEMKGPVKDRLRRYGLPKRSGWDPFSPTIGTAVRRYVTDAHVDWRDWEDAPP